MKTHHVERLEHLTLVGRAVTVHRERRVLFARVLLREGEASTERHLCADDTVATLEGLSEDVHRTALPLRHSAYATEELADEALDGAATEQDERVCAVRRDDVVVERRRRVDTDGDRFLQPELTPQHDSPALLCPRQRGNTYKRT